MESIALKPSGVTLWLIIYTMNEFFMINITNLYLT